MVYERRYYKPFVGTTETIADDAITADKIGDKAVGTALLADDAVISEKIRDETIRSEDIKAGEVKTSDLANSSVTTAKIADGAVTKVKLLPTIPTRPLTPGVTSAEIGALAIIESKIAALAVATAKLQDGSVTAAKLAGDAVETVKIKNDAITSAKIAPDSILAGDIAAGAIKGPEIQDLAVSTPKLSSDAVETVKIKDKNVTAPKIADEIMDALFGRRPVFYDDFFGAILSDRWAAGGDAGGTVDMYSPHIVSLATGAVNGDDFRIDWDGNGKLATVNLPKMTVKLNTYTLTDILMIISLHKDLDNYIGFFGDTSLSPNWQAICRKAAAETLVDTGILIVNAQSSKFKIDVTADGAEVKFYIDDALVATINTNVIDTAYVEPKLYVFTRTADIRLMRADYVVISEDRA